MIRHNLLAEALTEAKIPDNHKQRWLDHDLRMKPAMVKKSVDECEGLYRNAKILVVPKP